MIGTIARTVAIAITMLNAATHVSAAKCGAMTAATPAGTPTVTTAIMRTHAGPMASRLRIATGVRVSRSAISRGASANALGLIVQVFSKSIIAAHNCRRRAVAKCGFATIAATIC